MPYKSHICQCFQVQIWDNYVSIYTSYKSTAINNGIRNIGIHTLHIGISPWTNILATLQLCIPLNCYSGPHIDCTLLYIWVKTKTNCNQRALNDKTCSCISMYVIQTAADMPTLWVFHSHSVNSTNMNLGWKFYFHKVHWFILIFLINQLNN